MTSPASRLCAVFALLGLVALTGCSRHVVIDPDRVFRHNDREWTVKSTPGSAPSGAAALPPSSPTATPTAPPPSPPR